MHRVRVGVVRGGPSHEYEVSLRTGAEVLQHLPSEKYQAKDIFIDTSGVWHHQGRPVEPISVLRQVDVVFNALHGTYGEDGQIQRLMDTVGVRYTGSKALGSAFAMNKLRAKDIAKTTGLKTPGHVELMVSSTLAGDLVRAFKTFSPPLVVKPAQAGSSVGVSLPRTFAAFEEAVRAAFEISPRVLIEEYIQGKEATVGVLEHFRSEPLYAMLPVEIVPKSGSNFFDYDAKYKGNSEERCPGNFTKDETDELSRLAKSIHEALGLRHYSRSDFIIHPKRGIFYLETNTLPGLTSESLVPKALKAVGCEFPDFLDHLLTLALHRH